MATSTSHSPTNLLASLPTEIRLQIYDHCLAFSSNITITAAPVTVFGHIIEDRSQRTNVPGLPATYRPLVRYYYNSRLLSLSNLPTISIDNGIMDNIPDCEALRYAPPLALLATCRLINDELSAYMKKKREKKGCKEGGLSLYVTYPYGVLILKELYPFLAKQAMNVYISGYYTSEGLEPTGPISPAEGSHGTFANGACSSHSGATNGRLRLRLDPPRRMKPPASFLPFPKITAKAAPIALSSLIQSILGPSPGRLQKLEARIFYAGMNSYGTIWSDEEGPIVQILRNICGGRIKMEITKGMQGMWGNGMVLEARPKPESRVVGTIWTRLDQEGVDRFVVGDDWGKEVDGSDGEEGG